MGCDASLHARRPSANHVRDQLKPGDSVAAMASLDGLAPSPGWDESAPNTNASAEPLRTRSSCEDKTRVAAGQQPLRTPSGSEGADRDNTRDNIHPVHYV